MLPNLPHPASNLESHKNNLKQRRQISFTASRPLLNLRIDSESLPRPNIYYESNDPRSEEQNQRDPPSLHSAKTSLDCRQTAGERGLLSASGSRLTGRNYSSMKSPVARTSPIIARQVVTGDLYQSPKYHGELGPSCENKIFNDESSDQSRRTNNPPVKGGARQYPIDSGSTSEEYADYDEIIYPHY
ncbi:expressed protein [Phakopsora pachyrhizi]|uniref:Expressed protein n=1 Tax=Phakopsora pachyrhizi TaxID=170000 RepID=A0AAV0B391_PHAPC|nr:expressed protein [Phakopsora pachyrhizi]